MNKNILLFLLSITVVFGATVMAQSVITNISNSDYGVKYAKDIVQQRYHHIVNAQQTAFQNLPIKNVALPVQSSPHSYSLTDIFKQVQNSVVQITSKGNGMQIIINGNPPVDQQSRLGSGFVYDQQGHIISNSHVVSGAKTVDVTFVDGNTYTANVIGNDPSSDVAVLQITDNNYSSAEKSGVPLAIANSSKLQVGEQIIAIGNPFGLSDTMTTGIVSQIGRLLPNQDTGFSIPNGIQTDAAINPGNSGGPLLNMQGQVVGMNTAILSGTGGFSGLGFAIPSNIIIRIVPTLIQKGSYDHPWLGISGGSMTADVAQSAGLPINYKGVVVSSIQSGSPADKAGLKGTTRDIIGPNTHIGDIITAIDGRTVKRIDDIINYIEMHKSVGSNVKLTINRNGQTRDLNAVLQARPSSIVAQ
ncbi:MAG TPA: trypsin-like peptidase domain-containing protein [Nitrososphaeraceae archaeon]|nr:trypsin-like peptidase domain-containing protein [Nitrososphaeraceae archaeon]